MHGTAETSRTYLLWSLCLQTLPWKICNTLPFCCKINIAKFPTTWAHDLLSWWDQLPWVLLCNWMIWSRADFCHCFQILLQFHHCAIFSAVDKAHIVGLHRQPILLTIEMPLWFGIFVLWKSDRVCNAIL